MPVQNDTDTKTADADDVFHMSQIDDLPVTSAEIQWETRKDKVLASVLNQTMNGWENTDNKTLNPYYNRRNEITVSHGCLM